MTVSFTGVGSGTDWSSLITQLTELEKAPADALTTKKASANTQLSLVADMVSRLSSLGSAATAVNSPTSLWSLATTSSDTSRVTATASGAGTPGVYGVTVDHLARGENRSSTAFDTAKSPGDGSVSITVGSGTAINVAYTSTDTLSDIAQRINDANGGVTASALYDGNKYRLVVSSQATGTANAMSVTETGASLGLGVVQAARDAQLSVNGITLTRGSNHLTDVIPGVTLDLSGTTPTGGSETLVNVARDSSSVSTKLHSLIDAYNNVAQLVGSQLSYTGTKKGDETLFGDPIISGLQNRMGALASMTTPHGTGTLSGRDMGISLGADGKLTIDDTKLSAKLASDPSAANDFISGDSGFAKALSTLANSYTASTGVLMTREDSLRSRMKSYDAMVTQINDRADAYKTRLTSQFAALDQIMAAYSTNSSYLTKIGSNT